MLAVPSELEKTKKEIDKSMEIYAIMDKYNFKFSEEEIKRKWLVFGGPKDVLNTIEKQKAIFSKEKNRFKDKMDHD